MNLVKERILDLELQEVIGGHTAPDLEERIMTALDAPARSERRLAVHPALAAAAVILIAAGVWWAATLGPGEAPTPPPPPLLTAAQAEQVDQWASLLQHSQTEFDLSKPEGGQQAIAIMNAKRDLRHFMEANPDAFPAIRERLVPLPGADAPGDLIEQLLEVLARGPEPGKDPEVLRLVDGAKEKLTSNLLVTLAERKVEPAREILAGMLTEGRVDPGTIPAAIYYGLRGDPRGEEELRAAIARAPMPGMMPGYFVGAAAALHRLGDPAPWRQAVALARQRIKQYDAMGRVVMMAEFVVTLDYFNDALATGDPVPVGDVMTRTKEAWIANRANLATAAQLNAILDSLEE